MEDIMTAQELMEKFTILVEDYKNLPEHGPRTQHLYQDSYTRGGGLGRELMRLLAANPGVIGVKMSDAEVALMEKNHGCDCGYVGGCMACRIYQDGTVERIEADRAKRREARKRRKAVIA
jgi:hypothetical protein